MKKVDLFVEFMDDVEMTYASFCVGLMDEQFIYAKRTDNTLPNDSKYIQVSINDTIDCMSDCKGIKPDFVARSIEVSNDDGFSDSRIILNPSISEELKAEISAAVEESLG